ncbi:FxLYD domain-containing protein, partial [Paenibacillus polymyxa]|nr:FxLYD domain-containing protein [Paenibacillus polymyxa]
NRGEDDFFHGVSIAVLACASAAAGAQSLAYGITLGNVQAVRDSTRNVSTITGFLANQSERPVNSVLLTYVLYDAQNREVGGSAKTSWAPSPQ